MLSDEEKAIEELKNKIADYFMISNLTGKTLVNLIEKQSKEIEELKEENENLLDALNNSIDIKKYWVNKDKIKAKIEEWQKEKEFYDKDEDREWGQYNNWDWVDTIINEMQSLLEKE